MPHPTSRSWSLTRLALLFVVGMSVLYIASSYLTIRRLSADQRAQLTAAPTTVVVEGHTLLGQTSAVSFACVDLDWWPETKCDYGRCAWGRSSMLNIDVDDARLRAALRALSPVFLRLGGSLSDFVRYEMSGDAAAAASCNASFGGPTLSTRLGFPIGSGCLGAARWDALNKLCRETGCRLVFSVNALAGRHISGPCPPGTDCLHHAANHSCCTRWRGDWDPSNAAALLRYTQQKGHAPWGAPIWGSNSGRAEEEESLAHGPRIRALVLGQGSPSATSSWGGATASGASTLVESALCA